MRLLLTYSFALALLVLISGTAVELAAHLQFSRASNFRQKENFRSPSETEAAHQQRIAEWASINHLLLSPTDAALEAAHLLNARAAAAALDDRVSLYCESLHQLGVGLKKEPFNARLLVTWANTRQLLGDVDCGLEFAHGNYLEALREALRSAPADMRVKYAAGLVHSYAGNKQEANKLFGEVLAEDPSLAPQFRSHIFGQVIDAQTFNTVIPPRFPQILQFSAYLSENCNDLAEALTHNLRAELAEAQLTALKESGNEVTLGHIPSSLHLKRLISMSAVSAGESVRRAVDAGIGEIAGMRGDRDVAEYYRSRASLASLVIIHGTIPRDSRVLKNPLASWDENPLLAFDDNYRSVGFYLAAGQTPVFLALSSENGAFFINSSSLKVLVSEDNQEWVDLSPETKVTPIDDGTNHLLSIKVPEEYHKYWKVNFASANKDRKLTAHLSSMLRAYGRSSRTEDAGGGCL